MRDGWADEARRRPAESGSARRLDADVSSAARRLVSGVREGPHREHQRRKLQPQRQTHGQPAREDHETL